VDDIGLADTVVPVPAESPADGLHIYVVPPPAFNKTNWPLQRMGAAGLTVIVGFGLMVTVTVDVLVQPLASVPVTVYVVVAEGLAETVAPVVADSPVPGLHAYVFPPTPFSSTDPPLQSTGADGLTEMVGFGLMVTVTVEVFVQPFTSVPVTVYVVVVLGLAETFVPVVAESPVPGPHTYVFPPTPVSSTDPPLQRIGADGLTEMVDLGLIVTVTLEVFVQPFTSVPVTV
jgi:PII-like signaling protein